MKDDEKTMVSKRSKKPMMISFPMWLKSGTGDRSRDKIDQEVYGQDPATDLGLSKNWVEWKLPKVNHTSLQYQGKSPHRCPSSHKGY
jgi:hypothetical protein